MIDANDSNREPSRFLSYITLGFQLLGFMVFFGCIGYWLDHKTKLTMGYGVIIGLVLGIVFGMIYTIRSLLRMK
ncbi:MAG: AtpZ/AtpI family protein [Flavobacteriales bacterium]|jgi:F0F1-type ATP synthase assembly protein I